MSLAYLVMAAETTLLFSASATVQSSTALPTKSWPFKKKWWRSWTCFSFFFFLSLAVSSLFLVHPTRLSFFPYHWSFVYVRLEGKFCLPFAPCFASLLSLVPASAEALRLLASVQRFASEAAICDLQMTWARSCWWLLRRFCKSTLVMCDMMRLESSPLAISTGKLLFSWHKIEPLYSR